MPGRVEVLNPPGMHKPVGYSHVARSRGTDLVFISGQVSMDATGVVIGPGDYSLQAEQTFRNLKAALEGAGSSFRSVLRFTIFVTDIRGLPEIRAVRNRYIDPDNPPASTAVQVSRLFRPELLLEIDAVAAVEGP
jgi:enamine deaminase RidA (YjgF/YER057c/UK114 family)